MNPCLSQTPSSSRKSLSILRDNRESASDIGKNTPLSVLSDLPLSALPNKPFLDNPRACRQLSGAEDKGSRVEAPWPTGCPAADLWAGRPKPRPILPGVRSLDKDQGPTLHATLGRPFGTGRGRLAGAHQLPAQESQDIRGAPLLHGTKTAQ